MKHILLYLLLLIAIPLHAGRIHDAAYHQDLKTVKEIVKKNPKAVNERDSLGRTPLHYAAWDKNYDIVKYLIKHKADINALDSEGYTAIHKCFYWDSAMVVLLLKNGAKITLDSPRGQSLLHTFSSRRWGEYPHAFYPSQTMLEQLLASKNDVNANNNRGQTPLHYASYSGKIAMAKQLVTHGADINARDEDNYTPLNYTSGKIWFMIPKGFMLEDPEIDGQFERWKKDRGVLAEYLKSLGATEIPYHK